MRGLLALILFALLAFLSVPEAAMAHGTDAAPVVADCGDCGAVLPDEDISDMPHGCPHLTGCAAMALSEPLRHAPATSTRGQPHGLPGTEVLSGRDGPIDLRPPRA